MLCLLEPKQKSLVFPFLLYLFSKLIILYCAWWEIIEGKMEVFDNAPKKTDETDYILLFFLLNIFVHYYSHLILVGWIFYQLNCQGYLSLEMHPIYNHYCKELLSLIFPYVISLNFIIYTSVDSFPRRDLIHSNIDRLIGSALIIWLLQCIPLQMLLYSLTILE